MDKIIVPMFIVGLVISIVFINILPYGLKWIGWTFLCSSILGGIIFMFIAFMDAKEAAKKEK